MQGSAELIDRLPSVPAPVTVQDMKECDENKREITSEWECNIQKGYWITYSNLKASISFNINTDSINY